MPSRAALELLLQLKDEATAAAAKVEGGLTGAAVAYDKTTAANDRLMLAQLKAEQAAQRLADAQINLAHNTDPDREERLATEVAKAAVAFDAASEKAQQAAAAVEHAGQEAGDTTNLWTGLESGITKLNSTIQVAKELWQGLQEVYGATVGAAIDYSERVEDLARTAGISAAEASKMLEANRALKLSYEDTQQAAEMAAKRGIRLNAEEMAKLADRYVALEDPVKRAQMLVEVFGRSGLKTAEAMSQGGQAFREAGEAAEALGHTMDTETVESLQRVQAEIERLKRAGEWVLIKVGITITDAAETAAKIGGLITGQPFRDALAQHIDALNKSTGPYETYIAEVRRAAGVIGLQIDATGNLVRVTKDAYGNTYTQMVEASAAMTQAQWDAVQSSQALQGEQEQYGYLLDDLTVTVGRITDATGEFGDTMDQVWREKSIAYDAQLAAEGVARLDFAMTTLEPHAAAFRDRVGELSGKAQEYQDKIAGLEARRWLTAEQRADLEETRTKLSEVKGAIAEVTEEHNAQTRQIVYNEAKKAMSVGGFTDAERATLDAMAKNLGLVGEASMVQAKQIEAEIAAVLALQEQGKLTAEEAAASLAATAGRQSTWFQRQLREAKEPFDDYAERIKDLPDGKETTVTANAEQAKRELGAVHSSLVMLEELDMQITVRRRGAVGASGASGGAGGYATTGEELPGRATGTQYWPGGLVEVGESGPEVVQLPRGSRVYSRGESERMGGLGSATVQFNGPVSLSSELDVEEFAYRVAQRVAELTQ